MSADFDIASALLGEADAGRHWANLGLWGPGSHTHDRDSYTEACRELARQTGEAARLAPGQRVLDLACGNGASLALWPAVFGVAETVGLEWQAACIRRIRQVPPATLGGLHHARFDVLPLPPDLSASSFDAVVCVDAAYHARSLPDFAAFAARALRPGGRLAFNTLLRPESLTGFRYRFWQGLLTQAGIPSGSFLPEAELRGALIAKGFTGITVMPQSEAVLAGFAAFVAARRSVLSWRQRRQPGWRKIAATAWLCRQLYQRRAAHYALVSCTLSSGRLGGFEEALGPASENPS